MITARFIRFKALEAPNNYGYVEVCGFKVFGINGATILNDTTKTGVIFTDTSHYPGYPASLITSDTSGFSGVKSNNPVITIEFPNQIDFIGYSLKLNVPAVNSIETTGFILEHSLDGISYTQLDYKTGITSSPNSTLYFSNEPIAIVVDSLIDLSSTKSFPPIEMKKDALMSHAEPLPTWEGGSVMDFRLFPTVDRAGVISGTLKVQGVLQNKARVSLYFRKTGQLIQSTFTNQIGVFEFRCGLNRNVADYYAVAITDQPFNAQVFDKLQPI